MAFNSLFFIFLFAPVFFLVYFAARRRPATRSASVSA
jgi:hypothetical protein